MGGLATAQRAGLATLLALTACGAESGRDAGSAPASRPSILLVTLCTFRYSHMGAAGYDRPTTPFLDAVAERGLFFENAVSASSWTKPATASILTGLTPGVHGMTDFYDPSAVAKGRIGPVRVLPDEITTLAESLGAAGYATAAASNNIHVSEHFDMLQGFDAAVANARLDAARMVDVFGSWIGTLPAEQPFFFFLLSRDAHVTFDPDYAHYLAFDRSGSPVPREGYRRYAFGVRERVLEALASGDEVPEALARQYIDLYDAELAQQDRALAALPRALARAGRADSTVVVVTADHGERFFEHGLVGHGARLDEPVVHIPLVLAGPGIPAGVRDPSLVRSIDIFPTLATLGGAPRPGALQGRDLLARRAAHTEPRAGDRDDTEAFATVYDSEHMLRRGPYSFYLRKDGTRELYDLSRDRAELRDLAAARPRLGAQLHAALLAWLERERGLRESLRPGEGRTLGEDAVEALRELGYVQ